MSERSPEKWSSVGTTIPSSYSPLIFIKLCQLSKSPEHKTIASIIATLQYQTYRLLNAIQIINVPPNKPCFYKLHLGPIVFLSLVSINSFCISDYINFLNILSSLMPLLRWTIVVFHLSLACNARSCYMPSVVVSCIRSIISREDDFFKVIMSFGPCVLQAPWDSDSKLCR